MRQRHAKHSLPAQFEKKKLKIVEHLPQHCGRGACTVLNGSINNGVTRPCLVWKKEARNSKTPAAALSTWRKYDAQRFNEWLNQQWRHSSSPNFRTDRYRPRFEPRLVQFTLFLPSTSDMSIRGRIPRCPINTAEEAKQNVLVPALAPRLA